MLSVSLTYGSSDNDKENAKKQEAIAEHNESFKEIAEINEPLLLSQSNVVRGFFDSKLYITNLPNSSDEYGLFCKARDKKGNVVASCFICNCKNLQETVSVGLQNAENRNAAEK